MRKHPLEHFIVGEGGIVAEILIKHYTDSAADRTCPEGELGKQSVKSTFPLLDECRNEQKPHTNVTRVYG